MPELALFDFSSSSGSLSFPSPFFPISENHARSRHAWSQRACMHDFALDIELAGAHLERFLLFFFSYELC
jgi:hypothetical protein